jgi:hypothetical protein
MNEIKGKTLLRALDKCIAEEYGIDHLTEREQALFLLGMRMGNVATNYIIMNNIPQEGSNTSYNYLIQCKDIYKKDKCFEGGYYWQKLQEIAKE